MKLYKLKGGLLLTVMMVLAVVTLQVSASASTHAADGSSSGKLYTMVSPCNLVSIDPDTSDVQVIGSIGSGAEAFAFSPDGILFAASDVSGCHTHGSAQSLITVDTQTGAGTNIGPIGFGDVEAIVFAPDGTLFGVDASTDNLININPVTGQGTVIGSVGYPFIGGIAFSPDGTLYAVDISGGSGGNSTLLTIDPATGQATAIGDVGFNTIEGLTFTSDGTLYGISDFAGGGTGQLVAIDRATGAGTAAMQVITSGNMDGLAAYGLANHLTCDDTELYPNQTVDVDLIASGTDVYGLQATCAADGSVAQVQSGSFGGFFPNIAAGANQVSGNSWYGAASQQNPAPAVSGSGTFATLMYGGVAPGTTDVTCDPLFSDRDGFEIDGAASACTITVLDYGHITGTVTYQGRLDHANIEVVATGPVTDMDLTDSAGNFDLDELHAGDYAVKADVALYLPACTASDVNVTSGGTVALPSTRLLGGDVNDNVETDLVINIGDATLVAANLDPSNPPADARADINADGVANVQDWSILQGNYEVSGCQAWQ